MWWGTPVTPARRGKRVKFSWVCTRRLWFPQHSCSLPAAEVGWAGQSELMRWEQRSGAFQRLFYRLPGKGTRLTLCPLNCCIWYGGGTEAATSRGLNVTLLEGQSQEIAAWAEPSAEFLYPLDFGCARQYAPKLFRVFPDQDLLLHPSL